MKCSKRQGRLGLEPPGAQHLCLVGAADEVYEKGRLADPRLTSHDQTAGRPVPGSFEEFGQVCLFTPAAD